MGNVAEDQKRAKLTVKILGYRKTVGMTRGDRGRDKQA